MELQHLGADVQEESDNADGDANDVDNVVSVTFHVAGAATLDAALLVGLEGTAEGLQDGRGLLRVAAWRGAGCAGEGIDEA